MARNNNNKKKTKKKPPKKTPQKNQNNNNNNNKKYSREYVIAPIRAMLRTYYNHVLYLRTISGHLVPSSSVSNMSNHYTVLNNGTSLIISDVDRPDFGLYLCLVSIDGVIKASVRWTVNKDGPYYGDLWAKYWPQAKIGLLSGAAVFIFLSMLCINLDQVGKKC